MQYPRNRPCPSDMTTVTTGPRRALIYRNTARSAEKHYEFVLLLDVPSLLYHVKHQLIIKK